MRLHNTPSLLQPTANQTFSFVSLTFGTILQCTAGTGKCGRAFDPTVRGAFQHCQATVAFPKIGLLKDGRETEGFVNCTFWDTLQTLRVTLRVTLLRRLTYALLERPPG